jgi:amino acid adenylation domain-containing protein/thioester reductase-like protein
MPVDRHGAPPAGAAPRTLGGRVHAFARTAPHRTAVVAAGRHTTYGELQARAEQLAGLLRSRGLGHGALLALHLGRSADVVAGMLAAHAVGAAYTVFEPATPLEDGVGRLDAAGADLVLAAPAHRAALEGGGLRVAQLPPPGRRPGAAEATTARPPRPGAAGDPAYVVYTSGSTGVPKGVVVTHDNVRHYTEGLLARLGVTAPLHYAHVTTLAADLGNTCLFAALWTGGTLHLVDDVTRRDPAGLLDYLAGARVDVLKTTPSHWNALSRAVEAGPRPAPLLDVLLLGGEMLTLPAARRILASGTTRTLVNHYGPSETTVGVAAHVLHGPAGLDDLDPAARSVPLGTALGRTRLFVRADDGSFHTRNAVGELYVAGPTVSLGYRGAAAAASAAFTDDLERARPGTGRAYRTGDRVRADAHGVLEFLGRDDRQVKVAGYRVELGHVEAALHALPEVSEAVVLHRAGQRPALVAAVVPAAAGHRTAPGAGKAADIRRRLRAHLPPHMVPDRVELLDAFPHTHNGKTDHRTLRTRIEARLHRRPDAAQPAHTFSQDPLVREVTAAWEQTLGHRRFGPHDDFAAAGGTSVDAIQVIARLQAAGHRVTAARFLAEPTVAALARSLADHDTPASEDTPAPQADDSALSPAQDWFFAQRFAQPDRWNQALLLDVDPGVSADALSAAVDDVVALHPLLHTAFRAHRDGVRRTVVPASGLLTHSVLPADEQAVRAHIRDAADRRQADLSVAGGRLFAAHLFTGGTRQAHLLLLCHHLAVDAVSWRIVVDDVSRCYTARLRGDAPARPVGGADFGAWATDLRRRSAELRADLDHWRDLQVWPAPEEARGDNLEGDAQTAWFALTRAETGRLQAAAAAGGTTVQACLLGAFAQALTAPHAAGELVVDVESHGRATDEGAVEVSRVVGWFTSTFPVAVEVAPGHLDATVKSATAALDAVPRLGIAYGLHRCPRMADVCVNYLGSFTPPTADTLRPALSRYAIGPVRGPANDRGHGLKLTARLHGGRLVADLSFTPARHAPERITQVCRETRGHLQALAGLPGSRDPVLVETGSSTGLLAQVPAVFHASPATAPDRDYGRVLLTGATGFIGAHLLHLLLTRTRAHVHALVRAPDADTARRRLYEAHDWYLPREPLADWADRVTVHPADLTLPRCGLDEETHAGLARAVEAIYHLAGDTRLFGAREDFEAHNVRAARRMVTLASTGRPKDLHHVSTLAVCGAVGDGEPVVFGEDSLDIGQRFLNEYEHSKFRAEQLVRDFAHRGGTAFVYRSGNVTGHSVTGRFQRNSGDNRLVQTLRGCIRLGRVPRTGRRGVVLSPVDLVAEGILRLSLSGGVTGGTHHVDSHHEVPYARIFAALRDLGCAVDGDDAADFAELFAGRPADEDEQIGLARFWANRPARNVLHDTTRTRRTLARLGVEFPALDGDWLRRFLSGAVVPATDDDK